MEVIRGKIHSAKKIVAYGPEGIGKSTFLSNFPDVLFIDTEGSTKDMDVARLEAPSSWTMLLEQVKYIKSHPDICRTLAIDTADWAEMMCIEHVCSKNQKTSVEDFGYGKGYTYVYEEFGRLLNLLTEVINAGITVAITAHAKMRKFEQPDEMGAYDRWEMKLSKGVAPMVKEWADMVLFCNYKTVVINVDGQGAQKGKNKVQGGKRVMYTTHHSCWDAKNRYGLPDEVPFDYESIRSIVESAPVQVAKTAPASVAKESEAVQVPQTTASAPAEDVVSKSTPEPEKESTRAVDTPTGVIKVDERIPKNLRDLMIANQVDEWDIQNVCEAKGYVPLGTPVYQYEEVNPGFTDGCLVGAWSKVYEEIKKMKEKDAVVFN